MKVLKITALMALLTLVFLPLSVLGEDQEVTGDGSADVKLYAKLESTYTVKLPKSVDITTSGTTFDYLVKGEIASNETLVVSIPGSCTIHETDSAGVDLEAGRPDITVTLVNSDTDGFGYSELPTEYGDAKGTVTVTHSGIPAGYWQGDLGITIGLK